MFDRSIVEVFPFANRARRALERLELRTVDDLLNHLPLRYEDRREVTAIRAVRAGESVTIRGLVRSVRPKQARTGRRIIEAEVEDSSGRVRVVWFNQNWVLEALRAGAMALFHGEIKLQRGGLQMAAADFELAADDDDAEGPGRDSPRESLKFGRIMPVYPTTRGLGQGMLRRLAFEACRLSPRPVVPGPYEFLVGGELDAAGALRRLHFPSSPEELEAARSRFVFEEYFYFSTRMLFRRRRFTRDDGIRLQVTDELDGKIRSVLPFVLTSDQDRAVAELRADLGSPRPMYRLLEGDVGTGKTAVALYALLTAVRNGHQGVIMAPTEVLAEQHHAHFSRLLERYPALRIELLTGSTSAAERARLMEGIEAGRAHIVVGTHAVIQESVRFRSIGVAVIDEQHRFGVEERRRLREKSAGANVLVMSATPIPRSLCLTAYGDLDLSILRERPSGRAPVVTRLVPESGRKKAFEFVASELERGRQAYFIYPLVEDSENLDLPSAETARERLRETFPGHEVGLLHGRMSSEEKDDSLRRFRDGRDRVLAATVVVEVGIDVPNATVLFIEDASRFGLAQLHQLRGRVGRGEHRGYCLVGYGSADATARERLEVFSRTSNGFEIAEEDLRLRGPGDFFGVKQSGRPYFRIGNPFRDTEGYARVRELAERFWSDEAFEEAGERYLDANPELREEMEG